MNTLDIIKVLLVSVAFDCRVVGPCLFFSRVHATLHSALSVGRSVGRSVSWLVGWLVGWSVGNAFIKNIKIMHFFNRKLV